MFLAELSVPFRLMFSISKQENAHNYQRDWASWKEFSGISFDPVVTFSRIVV